MQVKKEKSGAGLQHAPFLDFLNDEIHVAITVANGVGMIEYQIATIRADKPYCECAGSSVGRTTSKYQEIPKTAASSTNKSGP